MKEYGHSLGNDENRDMFTIYKKNSNNDNNINRYQQNVGNNHYDIEISLVTQLNSGDEYLMVF